MKNRFDLEEELMKCWHVTDDIDLVCNLITDAEMPANTQDKVLNILIGMKTLYDARFNTVFSTLEELIKQRYFDKEK
jgi:uncharacterized metal-binding protein